MIDNARDLAPATILECDLCIVGGGPAGIAIAHALRNTPLRIILLESGGTAETPEAIDLNRGHASPAGSHEPLEENRRRMWGGATSAWGGRCIPFDEIDFAARPWVPYSGWPFGLDELKPFYAQAMQLCDAGPANFRTTEAFPGKPREMIVGFDGPEVVTDQLERWSPPVHFGRRYAEDLRRAENIRVFFHANCLGVRLDEKGSRVVRIDAASEPDRPFSVKPRHCILAAGSLENTRLLLASNDVIPAGIGGPALGRYYMSHFFGAIAVARLRDPQHGFIYGFERDAEGVYCRRRFWITPRAQEAERMLNSIAFFFRPSLGASQHHSGLFSATYLAKFALGALRRHGPSRALALARENRAELMAHLRTAVLDAPSAVPEILGIVRQRFFARRRLPFVLPPEDSKEHYLFYQTEQAPNPDSLVRLHADRDRFGMPRLEAAIRFTELDLHTIRATHRLIAARFKASGTGELQQNEKELEAWMKERCDLFNSSAHQLGTTRLGTDPSTSVVDANCRVHGVANLHVAGGSVLPTGGHANPTLTVVALALRLAAHLKVVAAK
jgi:choline dehydrogenase-like flavoprotein